MPSSTSTQGDEFLDAVQRTRATKVRSRDDSKRQTNATTHCFPVCDCFSPAQQKSHYGRRNKNNGGKTRQYASARSRWRRRVDHRSKQINDQLINFVLAPSPSSRSEATSPQGPRRANSSIGSCSSCVIAHLSVRPA